MSALVETRGKPQYDIYVKGDPAGPELGDCPFSHRTMLTMEEKGIRYNKVLLDENAMPDWIEDTFGQKQIPFITELDSGKWMIDSDKIVPYLEDKFPERKLGKPEEMPNIDELVFPYFLEFIKSEGTNNQEEAQLVKELTKINEFLGKSGKYAGGDDVNAQDLSLAPKLKHIIVGSKAAKDWEVPKELSNIYSYMDRISQRDSWKATYYTEKFVADGWKLKQKKLRESS
jgi:glutathione S-transferase